MYYVRKENGSGGLLSETSFNLLGVGPIIEASCHTYTSCDLFHLGKKLLHIPIGPYAATLKESGLWTSHPDEEMRRELH